MKTATSPNAPRPTDSAQGDPSILHSAESHIGRDDSQESIDEMLLGLHVLRKLERLAGAEPTSLPELDAMNDVNFWVTDLIAQHNGYFDGSAKTILKTVLRNADIYKKVDVVTELDGSASFTNGRLPQDLDGGTDISPGTIASELALHDGLAFVFSEANKAREGLHVRLNGMSGAAENTLETLKVHKRMAASNITPEAGQVASSAMDAFTDNGDRNIDELTDVDIEIQKMRFRGIGEVAQRSAFLANLEVAYNAVLHDEVDPSAFQIDSTLQKNGSYLDTITLKQSKIGRLLGDSAGSDAISEQLASNVKTEVETVAPFVKISNAHSSERLQRTFDMWNNDLKFRLEGFVNEGHELDREKSRLVRQIIIRSQLLGVGAGDEEFITSLKSVRDDLEAGLNPQPEIERMSVEERAELEGRLKELEDSFIPSNGWTKRHAEGKQLRRRVLDNNTENSRVADADGYAVAGVVLSIGELNSQEEADEYLLHLLMAEIEARELAGSVRRKSQLSVVSEWMSGRFGLLQGLPSMTHPTAVQAGNYVQGFYNPAQQEISPSIETEDGLALEEVVVDENVADIEGEIHGPPYDESMGQEAGTDELDYSGQDDGPEEFEQQEQEPTEEAFEPEMPSFAAKLTVAKAIGEYAQTLDIVAFPSLDEGAKAVREKVEREINDLEEKLERTDLAQIQPGRIRGLIDLMEDVADDFGNDAVSLYRLRSEDLNAGVPYYVMELKVGDRKIAVAENAQFGQATYIFDENKLGDNWQEAVMMPKEEARILGADRLKHSSKKGQEHHNRRVKDALIASLLAN